MPIKCEHPFKGLEDADIFSIEDRENLAEGVPPVK
jgi:hypothetical protein